MVGVVEMKYTCTKVKLNILCLGVAIVYWVGNNRISSEDTFVVNPIISIVIYPILCYSLTFFLSLIFFKYSFGGMVKTQSSKIATIISAILFVNCVWMIIIVLLYITRIFMKNGAVYTFFKFSYVFLKTEIYRHIVSILGAVDAFYVAIEFNHRRE